MSVNIRVYNKDGKVSIYKVVNGHENVMFHDLKDGEMAQIIVSADTSINARKSTGYEGGIDYDRVIALFDDTPEQYTVNGIESRQAVKLLRYAKANGGCLTDGCLEHMDFSPTLFWVACERVRQAEDQGDIGKYEADWAVDMMHQYSNRYIEFACNRQNQG